LYFFLFFFFFLIFFFFFFLDFIDDLFILFANKVRNLSLLPSYSNILVYENFINRYIYIFLHGGISALDELQFDTWGNRKHLSEEFLKSLQGSTVPNIVGLMQYRSSVALLSYPLRDLAKKTLSLPSSTDVVPIWQKE